MADQGIDGQTPASCAVTGQLGDQAGPLRHCACGVWFRPKKWNQRFCHSKEADRAYNAAHPVARQRPLPLDPPPAPLPPVVDQRVPKRERSRLEGHARLIWNRLEDGPATNRELALLLAPGAAWRTRLSDLRCWLRRHGGPAEPIPHYDCGDGLVWYWIEAL